jgi:group I intron endonuclease
MEQNNMGIYKITNIINDKVYIGSSVDVKNRIRHHKFHLSKNTHNSPKLQNAYNKYGSESFIYEIIEIVETKELLLEREQFYIDSYVSYKLGYNSRHKAEANYGLSPSAETRKKISDSLKGRIGPNKDKIVSDETKAKISEAKKGKPSNRKGSKHSEESKEKMSQLRKGIKWNKNYTKPSEETKDKIRQTMIKKGLGGKPKPCKIDGIVYESAKIAAQTLNIPYQRVIDRLKSKNFEEWTFFK